MHEGVYMKENITFLTSELQKLIDTIGTFQTAWGLIVTFFILIVFVVCVLAFRYNVNNASKIQIRKFEKEGKYLSSVYVELHSTMESLRYFVFSYKWKRRIIKQYNHLFEGYEGARLEKIFGQNMTYKLSVFSTLSSLNTALDDTYNCLKDLRENHRNYYKKYGEIVFLISNSTFWYIDAIEQLKELCAMISEKNIVLVGSAGNGKTSMLCRMSETIISNKMPCMLINSRDIKEDCTDFIMKKLPLSKALQNKANIYLRLVSILLFLQKKHFYILIDAINENDCDVFVHSVGKLIDTFSSYKRIRILFTCRSEYFDSRYKKLFSSGSENPYIFNLTETHYDKRATKKMIDAYMNHYKVRGPFSLEMSEKLMNSLFLTRIFFEVNSNRNECMLEFRNSEIYKLYFEKIAAENSEFDLKGYVNKTAELMISNFSFDRVPIEELCLSTEDLNSFRKLLDNNLIISHSIHAGTGITEREEEYVYFVFDELRDFCLARYLLMADERNQDNNYTMFFTMTNLLFEQRLSPTEGVVNYAYHHFKETAKNNLCKKILETFGESDIQSIFDWEKRRYRGKRLFKNFGFKLIFSEGYNISPFEIEYIIHCIEKNCDHYWNMFWYLLSNEYSGFKPNLDLAVKIIANWKDYRIPEKIFECFFDDKLDKRLMYYHDNTRKVDTLIEWVEDIEIQKSELSESLKIMLVILSAYDPIDYALREYHKLVFDETIYEKIKEKFACSDIKAAVSELREQESDILNNYYETDYLFLLGGNDE